MRLDKALNIFLLRAPGDVCYTEWAWIPEMSVFRPGELKRLTIALYHCIG